MTPHRLMRPRLVGLSSSVQGWPAPTDRAVARFRLQSSNSERFGFGLAGLDVTPLIWSAPRPQVAHTSMSVPLTVSVTGNALDVCKT